MIGNVVLSVGANVGLSGQVENPVRQYPHVLVLNAEEYNGE